LDLQAEASSQPSEDLATQAEEVLAESTADLWVPAPHSGHSINDKIDQLTDQLAAFCLEKLQNNMMSSDNMAVDMDTERFASELQVRAINL
jgi:hypothetical protein